MNDRRPLDPDDDPDLEDEFPLGDGTADTEAEVVCPHCGEMIELAIDPGSGQSQEYVEDCEICCRPWQVTVTFDTDGAADVTVTSLDD